MKKYLVLIFASTLFLGGCAVEAVETVPEETVVTQTDPPFTGAIWIGTEYNWVGGSYEAVPAHWERPRGTWQGGRWNHTSRGYRWQRGSWHNR